MKCFKMNRLGVIIVTGVLLTIASCHSFEENPGNNTGKTGNGTTGDSLTAKKSDTGKGANQRMKLLKTGNGRDTVN